MKISSLSIILPICAALLITVGCKKAEKPAATSTANGAKTAVACSYPYDAEIVFSGPGGHSNGAYGRTSALHAAGRAVEVLTVAASPEGSVINVNSLYGGNSVNSIAGGATLVIESCSSTEAGAQAVAKLVADATDSGIKGENAFRNVKSGETNADGVRVDIRADIKKM